MPSSGPPSLAPGHEQRDLLLGSEVSAPIEVAPVGDAPVRVPCPGPGIYMDVPAETYHSWDAASSSVLKSFRNSPMHALDYLQTPKAQTPQQLVGSALHAAVLEPDQFQRHWIRGIKVDKRTKQGKADWAEFVAQAAGREVLTPAQHDLVLLMKEKILCHPVSARLNDAAAMAEVSVVWDDHETGVRCKMRADHAVLRKGRWFITDIKTSSVPVSPDSFAAACANWGYDLQSAFYWDGWNHVQNDDVPISFDFIAVETVPPHGVATYTASHDMLELGRFWYRRYLAQYKECKASGQWPGYPQKVVELEPPKWAMFRAIEAGADSLLGGLVKADD